MRPLVSPPSLNFGHDYSLQLISRANVSLSQGDLLLNPYPVFVSKDARIPLHAERELGYVTCRARIQFLMELLVDPIPLPHPFLSA